MVASEETKQEISLTKDAKGFALTVKDNLLDSILAICEKIRPCSFLQDPATLRIIIDANDSERPFFCSGDKELLLIADESALISAIDHKQILSW